MRYRKEIEVNRDAPDAFDYLADFSRASEWDPGIADAQRLTAGPTTVGSRFEVIALFRGKQQRFEYVVTAYDEGRRIALVGIAMVVRAPRRYPTTRSPSRRATGGRVSRTRPTCA